MGKTADPTTEETQTGSNSGKCISCCRQQAVPSPHLAVPRAGRLWRRGSSKYY